MKPYFHIFHLIAFILISISCRSEVKNNQITFGMEQFPDSLTQIIDYQPFYTDGIKVYFNLNSMGIPFGGLCPGALYSELYVMNENVNIHFLDSSPDELDSLVVKKQTKHKSVFILDPKSKILNEIYNDMSGNVFLKFREHYAELAVPIEGVTLQEFTYIGNLYFKTKKNVYCGNRVINEASPASFKILQFTYLDKKMNSGYAVDENHVYYEDSILPDANPKKFKMLAPNYFSDDNVVYIWGRKIDGADPATFVELESRDHLSKDKNNVYRLGVIIEGADPATFQILSDGY